MSNKQFIFAGFRTKFLSLLTILILSIPYAGNVWGDTYSLVTDASTLASGDEIIIVNDDSSPSYAIGEQANNNRTGASVTPNALTGKITPGNTVQIITLGTATKTVNNVETTFWTFVVGTNKWLYAAGSNKNYLKTQTTLDDNGKWSVSISNGTATITAQGTNRPLMRYNPNNGSPIFSCYATGSTTGSSVRIYKKDGTNYTVVFHNPFIIPSTSSLSCPNLPCTEDYFPLSINLFNMSKIILQLVLSACSNTIFHYLVFIM